MYQMKTGESASKPLKSALFSEASIQPVLVHPGPYRPSRMQIRLLAYFIHWHLNGTEADQTDYAGQC